MGRICASATMLDGYHLSQSEFPLLGTTTAVHTYLLRSLHKQHESLARQSNSSSNSLHVASVLTKVGPWMRDLPSFMWRGDGWALEASKGLTCPDTQGMLGQCVFSFPLPSFVCSTFMEASAGEKCSWGEGWPEPLQSLIGRSVHLCCCKLFGRYE